MCEMFLQQFEKMISEEKITHARNPACEFIVTGRPVFCNTEIQYEYDIKVSDSPLYWVANKTPGTSDVTKTFVANP